MQIFALDQKKAIRAMHAEKRKDYICPECGDLVRLKSGSRRIKHFFHIKKSSTCRQAKKGLVHLRLQNFIQYLLERENAEIEKIFPEIGRIADVACTRSKKIYEVQYSPMTPEEAKGRCYDYESIGFQVVWILHDHTYKPNKKGPLQQFLQSKTCYYTNMDKEGNGMIYDFLPSFGKRAINLRKCRPLPLFGWPNELFSRGKNWSYYHEGDYFDLTLRGKFPYPNEPFHLLKFLKSSYLEFLDSLLKNHCE